MNQAIEQFRASMKALGYADQHIEGEIMHHINMERLRRKQTLLDGLEAAMRAMTDEELRSTKGGEL